MKQTTRIQEDQTYDTRSEDDSEIISPKVIRREFPLDAKGKKTVVETRKAIEDVFLGKNDKLIVIPGPCSIHSEIQALMYGQKLRELKEKTKETMIIIMRTYFEKPRSTVGWEGLISDPFLDGSYYMNEGIVKARNILVELNNMGIPCAMEMLTQLPAERLTGCLSWVCIGARNCESPVHRRWASALSTPVGFKNNTFGEVQPAIDGIVTAAQKHRFPGHNENGKSCIKRSKGNPFCHVVLRGGNARSNYDPTDITKTEEDAKKSGKNANIIIDCSHGNSGKKYQRQGFVFKSCMDQIASGDDRIKGLMLESCLEEGKQKEFEHGVTPVNSVNDFQSITDGCIGWEETEELIMMAHEALLKRNEKKAATT